MEALVAQLTAAARLSEDAPGVSGAPQLVL
jgi:hypothetical protein